MNDDARLSRLLWNARELLSMYGDTLNSLTGNRVNWVDNTLSEIDAYRAERGWIDRED